MGPGTLPDHLTERRKQIDRKYDYRYSQLKLVLRRLLYEHRLSEEDVRSNKRANCTGLKFPTLGNSQRWGSASLFGWGFQFGCLLLMQLENHRMVCHRDGFLSWRAEKFGCR